MHNVVLEFAVHYSSPSTLSWHHFQLYYQLHHAIILDTMSKGPSKEAQILMAIASIQSPEKISVCKAETVFKVRSQQFLIE